MSASRDLFPVLACAFHQETTPQPATVLVALLLCGIEIKANSGQRELKKSSVCYFLLVREILGSPSEREEKKASSTAEGISAEMSNQVIHQFYSSYICFFFLCDLYCVTQLMYHSRIQNSIQNSRISIWCDRTTNANHDERACHFSSPKANPTTSPPSLPCCDKATSS